MTFLFYIYILPLTIYLSGRIITCIVMQDEFTRDDFILADFPIVNWFFALLEAWQVLMVTLALILKGIK